MRIVQDCMLITLVLFVSNVIWVHSFVIDPVVTKTLERDGYANILVSMKAGTEDVLNNLARISFSSRTERSQAVYNALTTRGRNSQSQILSFLAASSTTKTYKFGNVHSLWITNQIGIETASGELIRLLATMDEISKIQEDEIVYLDQPIENRQTSKPSMVRANQWGIEKIHAPLAWLQFGGTNGTGIIVSNIDTGVRHTHEILRTNYKDDGHSWYDPYNKTAIPADYNGHGTHTMGTIVGTNGYGVAPQAKWIACKGLYDDNFGSGINLLACGQFLICPTTSDGEDADCSKTPHITSNSWGQSVGGSSYYDGMIAAWHAAGIIPIFSMGNYGPDCGTVKSPGDRDVIGVGSTTTTDLLSSFSSVGPTPSDTMKPDISAPGSSVTSADYQSDDTYRVMSGTSMACPHVAGTVALLLSRNPNLSYVQIKELLQSYADRDLSFAGSICNWISDSVFPNHHFGYGRLNANRTLQALVDEL